MSSGGAFYEYVMYDVFANIDGVVARPMFGSYGVYKDGIIFAIISDDRLYFKANNFTAPYFKEYDSQRFSYVAKGKRIFLPYWELPEEIIENHEKLLAWMNRSVEVTEKEKRIVKNKKVVPQRKAEIATFGAGCFWGVEEIFRQVDGVINVVVGYMGGDQENPTYEEVCDGKTGHVEVAQVTYNSGKINYSDLLEVFWWGHNPTTLNKQGVNVGGQYRSVIFYHTREQKDLARESKSQLQRSRKFQDEIVTAIMPATKFYPAEEYHQRYLERRGLSSCSV